MKTLSTSHSVITIGNMVDFVYPADRKKAQILYCDPPRGDGNCKYRVTLNKKHTGVVEKTVTNNDIFVNIKRLYDNNCKGYIIIETGLQRIAELATTLNLKDYKIYTTTYRSGSMIRESAVIFGTNYGLPLPIVDEEKILTMRGQKIVDYFIGLVAKEGEVLLDPCCGKCLIGRGAVTHGMEFIGNEMNLKRATVGHNYILSAIK